MKHVVIVGAGLFGSMAATLAESRGARVTLIDAGHPNAASKASGCVLKPSWLSSLSDEQLNAGYEVLGKLYNVEQRNLQSNLLVKVPVTHINPDTVLRVPDIKERVERVDDGAVVLGSGIKIKGKVLVAAGYWTQDLVKDMPRIRGLWGASFRFRPEIWEADRIHVYAPYRQAVALRLGNGRGKPAVWFGDGTALVEKSWTHNRVEDSAERATKLFALGGGKATVGVRPYVEGFKAGYFRRISPSTWVSTGGAKNGTMLAAAQAFQFVEEAL